MVGIEPDVVVTSIHLEEFSKFRFFFFLVPSFLSYYLSMLLFTVHSNAFYVLHFFPTRKSRRTAHVWSARSNSGRSASRFFQ